MVLIPASACHASLGFISHMSVFALSVSMPCAHECTSVMTAYICGCVSVCVCVYARVQKRPSVAMFWNVSFPAAPCLWCGGINILLSSSPAKRTARQNLTPLSCCSDTLCKGLLHTAGYLKPDLSHCSALPLHFSVKLQSSVYSNKCLISVYKVNI